MLFYFYSCYQLDSTITDSAFDSVIPVLEEPPKLTTIDTETLDRLCGEVEPTANSPVVQPTTAVASPAQEVGLELIGTCVTPTKVKAVQSTLREESERHLCALKLVHSIFTNEELVSSNADGNYGKKCLDSNKLNSLKVLVFTKYPVDLNEDKEEIWRVIKSKINSKCRVIRKFAQKDSSSRSL